MQVSIACLPSATEANRIRIAVCLKSIHWPMCQGPICFVSASAFSLVASRLTPKIPPTTGNVITHSSKFAIWLLLLCHATMRRGRPILNAGNTGYRACPDGVIGSAWDIGLRGFLTVQDRVAMRNQAKDYCSE